MFAYLVGRVVAAMLVVLFTTMVVFGLQHALPGDPISYYVGQSESSYTPEQLAAIRAEYGLNEPAFVQYAKWLGRLAVGDLGRSFITREPVSSLVAPRILPTLQIAIESALIGLLIGVTMGILAATRPNSVWDWFGTIGALVGAAIPFFLTASLLVLACALYLQILPASGYIRLTDDPIGSIRSTLLPAITLSSGFAAVVMRQTRSSLIDVLGNAYITTARSKGLRESIVIQRHALKNAFLPVLTVVAAQLAALFGGAVITETIFAIPGLGRLMVDSVMSHEYLVVQALVLIAAIVMVSINLCVDLLYVVLDPRIRLNSANG